MVVGLMVLYKLISPQNIIDFKNDEVSINIHACEGANEEEVLFLVGEIFSDIDFGEEVLFKDKNKIYNNCGGPNQSNQRTYVQLNINVPYSLFNNSPNVFYGVCMRKE